MTVLMHEGVHDDIFVTPEAIAFNDAKVIRPILQELLGADAHYLSIRSQGKNPVGSFMEGEKNRFHLIPNTLNYGVIPQGRLFILDLDLHRGSSASTINEQYDFFQEFFDTDFSKTLKVRTQTGGLHIYLRFPETASLDDIKKAPSMSLRSFNEAFNVSTGKSIILDADIRSSACNCYVIAPSSRIPSDAFKKELVSTTYDVLLEDNQDIHDVVIQTVTDDSFRRFHALKQMRHELNMEKKQKKAEEKSTKITKSIDRTLDPAFDATNSLRQSKMLGMEAHEELFQVIKEKIKEKEPYHAIRAFVKSSLHCCFDDFSLARICVDYGINIDSYKNRRMSFNDILSDISRFTPQVKFHGSYCDDGRRLRKEKTREQYLSEDFVLEEYLQKIKEKVTNREISRKKNSQYRKINPRVLDMMKIGDLLMESTNRKQPTQQIKDSVAIVEKFLQPLACVGAIRMILVRSKLSQELNITESRVAAAMRLLRQQGIILQQDYQRTGLSSTYIVPEKFTENRLTRFLRVTWAKNSFDGPLGSRKMSVVFDVYSGVYKYAANGQSLYENDYSKEYMKKYSEKVYSFTNDLSSSLVISQSYVKSDREWVENNVFMSNYAKSSMTVILKKVSKNNVVDYSRALNIFDPFSFSRIRSCRSWFKSSTGPFGVVCYFNDEVNPFVRRKSKVMRL